MKKAVLTTLQIVVTIGVLFLVFRDPHKRGEMARALGNADQLWLFVGFAIYGFVEIVAGIRWQLLLRVQGIVLSWTRVFMLLLVGLFFNFFIPGGTGGDVVKIFYLLKETPGKRSAALLSVLVDRLIGLFGLILLAGLLIAARWQWLTSSPLTEKWVWTALAILGGSVVSIAPTFVLTGFGLVHKLPARMPGRDKIAELALAYNLYGRAWRPSLAALVLSIIAHLGYFAVFYCAARAYQHDNVRIPTLGELCAILPIVNTIAAMPVSVGGLGVREGLFQIFLSNLHSSEGVPVSTKAVAVVISSTGYFLTLIWGLIGGVLYWFYRPSEHARFRDIQTEVAALEHTVAEEEVAMEIAEEEKR